MCSSESNLHKISINYTVIKNMILLSLSLDCNQVGWNFIAACYQRCRPHRASLTDNWQIKTGINCFLRNAQWKEKEEKRMHRYLVQLFWNWKPWIEKLFDLKMKQTFQFRLKFWCEHTQPHMHTQQIFSKNYFLSLILEANEMRTRVSVKKRIFIRCVDFFVFMLR